MSKKNRVVKLVKTLNKIVEIVDMDRFLDAKDKVEYIQERIDSIHSHLNIKEDDGVITIETEASGKDDK